MSVVNRRVWSQIVLGLNRDVTYQLCDLGKFFNLSESWFLIPKMEVMSRM